MNTRTALSLRGAQRATWQSRGNEMPPAYPRQPNARGGSPPRNPPAEKTARRVPAPAYLPAAARRQPTSPEAARRLACGVSLQQKNGKRETFRFLFYIRLFSVRYSVFSIATTVSSTTVSASSSSSDTISLPASGSNSTPLRFASNFLKSFEKKNPIAIITANTII